MPEARPDLPDSGPPLDDRLTSWKEIAAYLKRDVTTVQRWEKREGMPVHRHVHDRMGSVYAFRVELDAWVRTRKPPSAPEDVRPEVGPGITGDAEPEPAAEQLRTDVADEVH